MAFIIRIQHDARSSECQIKSNSKSKKKKNLPHWQENSKCWAYIPSKTGIIPPHPFCNCFSPPRSNVVFPWHLQFGMPQGVVPRYQEFYFHSLNINISCYSMIVSRCFTSNNIIDDSNRTKYYDCRVDTINKHDMAPSSCLIQHAARSHFKLVVSRIICSTTPLNICMPQHSEFKHISTHLTSGQKP